jgi:hypothetical protein
MSTQNTSGFKTFTATAVAIAAFVRVKVDSDGLISVAGATDPWIGVTQEAVAASGNGTVRLRNDPGTFTVTASAAVTRGNRLYPTAAGKVDDAVGTGNFTGWVAIEAATADGDQIEAAPVDDLAFTAHADQAVATDAATTMALANAMRSALVAAGIIKGAA